MGTTVALGYLAGILSSLSPCVLPLLPIVLGAALTQHRAGPLALAAGLAISFVVIGMFVATVGFAIGLDGGVFRLVAGTLLIIVGVVLLIPQMQTQFAVAAGPVANWTEQKFGGFSTTGLGGQFSVGLLLGAVWSPCVGPTLGAASLLAARGENLGSVAITMLAFGLGAATPLVLLGFVSREVMTRWRDRMLTAGKRGKMIMGALLVVTGIFIVTNFDKAIETWLVAVSPDWLTELTTRF
jgi:cytochrome c biogenesis protein CcdA